MKGYKAPLLFHIAIKFADISAEDTVKISLYCNKNTLYPCLQFTSDTRLIRFGNNFLIGVSIFLFHFFGFVDIIWLVPLWIKSIFNCLELLTTNLIFRYSFVILSWAHFIWIAFFSHWFLTHYFLSRLKATTMKNYSIYIIYLNINFDSNANIRILEAKGSTETRITNKADMKFVDIVFVYVTSIT